MRTDGTLACWGNSARGETNVPAGTFASIAAGPGFACAVSTDGAVACWGSNNQGTPPAR